MRRVVPGAFWATGLRVVRGASWVIRLHYAHAAHRFYYDPDFRHFSIGFRVVCVSTIR